MSRYRLHPTPAQEAALRDHCGPRPVHMEPGRRAARPLAPRPEERARLPGTVPAAHRRAGRAPVAGGRLPDRPAAGPARLRPGDGRVLRPGESGRAAVVAQGRAGRGIPDHRARQAVGRAPRVPPRRPGLGAQGRMGPVPLVPRRAAGHEVLPGHDGPGGPLARRLRRDPRSGPAPGNGQVAGIDRGVAVSAALSTGDLLHAPPLPRGSGGGCSGCSARSPAPRGARTAAAESSTRSPG